MRMGYIKFAPQVPKNFKYNVVIDKPLIATNSHKGVIDSISDYLPVHNDVNDFTLEWNKYVGYYSLTYNNCKYRLLDFQAVLETLE